MTSGDEKEATLARQVVEAVRQIAVHYGLWLAEGGPSVRSPKRLWPWKPGPATPLSPC